MRVIVAGATGFVGRQVLQECIANDKITHIYALSRRELAGDAALQIGSKVTVIIHNDFASYPTELLEKVSDAEACLWAIGGRVNQFPSIEAARHANVDTTHAAAKAFAENTASSLGPGKKFRFIFCSGKFTEWNQDKSLSFLNDSRKIKGQAEKGLFEVRDAHRERLEVFCVRPSGILGVDAGLAERWTGKLYSAIDVDVLARAMISIALDGYSETIIENERLKSIK
ncbi:hypothetical protein QQS21_009876 [Conoideocrella luteorostrata]|uniref:NAD(P)-binding domain-containing protein n=1 Tax=Conoideocrella luteorostrata TaxID=1105319 RepID=A0AAJ0FUP9_9HYPO|nr:hypothetical protein QQS21_009876 [Conoideocrella luteorostrata]